MESVIALDPGGRSGYAVANMDTNRLELIETGVLRQDQMARWLAERQGVVWLKPHGPVRVGRPRGFDVVVCEGWTPRRINGSMNWIEGDPLLSAQHVGQIRLIADLSGARYVQYPASDKPQAVANMPEALKALDQDSNEQHDQDARMHLWLYFWREWFDASVDPEETIV